METEYVFNLCGGALCLDLSNTLNGRLEPVQRERLESYRDLVSWSRQAGLLSEREARALAREAERRASEAEHVLAQARSLREAVYSIFSALAEGKRPPRGDLHALNALLTRAMAQLELREAEGRFTWRWRDEGDRVALDRMLWPVVRSAADLLTSPDHNQVRICAAEDCAWLFLDSTRNRSRRWCDMSECGNRAKARRFYRRKKASPS